uniref:Glyco_hydro_38N domain-containing protein n=1 Tax=Angiostrongylus cantonensis TaxID=6313 RepID=A0A0K0D717_ANGCA
LQEKRAVPFRWRQYFDSKGKADMLTHLLPYSHYDILNSCGPSQAICCEFDFKRMTHWSCPGPRPEPITSFNVVSKANSLLGQLELMSQMYDSNVILMMLGDDFRFDMIEEWHQHYNNFLPLFEEINNQHHAKIRFGTLSDYFNALERWYGKHKRQPFTLSGDFFPYK